MGKGEAGGTFNEEQLTMYKECFKLMDIDKDGVINKSDLRASFDNVGEWLVSRNLTSDNLINSRATRNQRLLVQKKKKKTFFSRIYFRVLKRTFYHECGEGRK
jgi:hypothetical protein